MNICIWNFPNQFPLPFVSFSPAGVYIVPECTLAGPKPFHWGGFYGGHNVTELTLCLWPATAAVEHGCHILRPQASHKNTGEEENGMWKKENKQHDWWASLILFSATPGWMTADRSLLSVRRRNNCSPPDRRDMLYQSSARQIYNRLCQQTKCFFNVFIKGRCNYFASLCWGLSACLQASRWLPLRTDRKR